MAVKIRTHFGSMALPLAIRMIWACQKSLESAQIFKKRKTEMPDMEDQQRGHRGMATVSNIQLGAPGASSLTETACGNFCNEHF